MKNILLSILLLCLGVSTLFSQNLVMETAETSITFKIKNFGLNVDGDFSEFQINANFEKDNLSGSYFSGVAKIKSIDTGIDARNKSLQKEEYFDSAQYPELTLSSTEIIKMDNGQYLFIGDLTIKGKTKNISFPFSIDETANYVVLDGAFEMDRRDFKVGKSSLILNKKVKVAITYKGRFN